MQKKRVLIISHSDPFGIGGGSFACHAYVKAFSVFWGGEADICIPAESDSKPDDTFSYNSIIKVPKRSVFSRLLSFFTGRIDRYSGFVKKLVRDNPDVYSTVVINGCRESGSMVSDLRSLGINVITVFHNFERDYFRDNCKIPFFRGVMLCHIRTLEKRAYMHGNVNLFLSQHDMDMYEKTYGVNSANRLTGVFEYKEIVVPDKQERMHRDLTFVITGLLNNKQGEDGISYFFDRLYGCLPAGSKVLIAGYNPTRKITGICKRYHNVTLIPNPADMNEIITRGDVYICPAKTGSGVKFRIMDGLKAGLPVITHEYSVHGFEPLLSKPYFRSFSTVDGFREIVLELSETEIMSSDIWSDYSDHYAFDTGLKVIKSVLEEFGIS